MLKQQRNDATTVADYTIVAQATAPGQGGVGIVRISGLQVKNIASELLKNKLSPRVATFGKFLTATEETIDFGIAIYFPAPNSFTGEDVLELHGHGGQVVIDSLLQRVLEFADVRLAAPGEFSRRAFLNGKLDLTQAEAIADLIGATTKQAAQGAIRSLQGVFGNLVEELGVLLSQLRMEVETVIDFADEADITRVNQEFIVKIQDVIIKLKQLEQRAETGILLQEGVSIAIVGNTNAGKSSLFNLLNGDNVAIVTDYHGTTRDLLRTKTKVDGVVFNLVDTAGFRTNPDFIEAEGIKRAKEEMKRADHLLYLVDCSTQHVPGIAKIKKDLSEQGIYTGNVTVVYNKIDLTKEQARFTEQEGLSVVYISVKSQEGLELLQQQMKKIAGFSTNEVAEDSVSARRRHVNLLAKASACLHTINADLWELGALELVAEELKRAHDFLGEITGKVTTEDLLDSIFSEFCLGK